MRINLSQEFEVVYQKDADGMYSTTSLPYWFTVNDYNTSKIVEYLRIEWVAPSLFGTGWMWNGFETMTEGTDFDIEGEPAVPDSFIAYQVLKTAMCKSIRVPFFQPILMGNDIDPEYEEPKPETFIATVRFIGFTDCGIELIKTSGDSPTPTPEPTPGPTSRVEFESVYLDQGDSYTWPSGSRERSDSNPPNNYPPSYIEFSQIWDEEDPNLRLVFKTGVDEDEAKVWEWGRFIDEEGSMIYEKVDQLFAEEYDNVAYSGWECNGTYYVTDHRENNPPADDEGGEE